MSGSTWTAFVVGQLVGTSVDIFIAMYVVPACLPIVVIIVQCDFLLIVCCITHTSTGRANW